jgi:quercetin 2,3-dioxygenase
VHFLQIWVIPDQVGLPPSYEQKAFPIEERRGQLQLAAPAGRDGTVTMHQDARLFVANLEACDRVVHEIERGRGLWLQLARGIVAVNGTEMRQGDGAAVEDEPTIAIEADTDAEFLLFDLG